MNKKVRTIDELKDSRIMFEKNPPAFGYFLILICLVFLTLAIGWSIKTPKNYIIQAPGTVTGETGNYVMCSYTGEITNCNLKEGMIVEEGDVLFNVKSTDYNVQAEQLELSKKSYETIIEKNELLVKSIKDDTNYFNDSDSKEVMYYSAFESYKSQIRQNTLDTSTYAAYGYSDEQIEAELSKNEGKISQIYYDSIASAKKAIEDAKLQIESIDAQLTAIGTGKDEYAVKATASGTLHLLADYKDGMVVQTTQTVASITPENSANVIEAYVSTADMARMHNGDKVQIVIDGLAQNVYGCISGEVRQIDSNLTAQETKEGNVSKVFKVLIDMDTNYVVSKTGDKVDIVNGMTATSRIIYDKVTYFNYALEKMGIKIRK